MEYPTSHLYFQAFHTLVNLRTTLKFVGVLQVLRVASATFAPLESYRNKRKLGEWPIATDKHTTQTPTNTHHEPKHTTNTHHEFTTCTPS